MTIETTIDTPSRRDRPEIPSDTVARVVIRDAHLCQKCLRPSALQVHHIIRCEDGGSDEDDNLVLLCFDCHRDWHHRYETGEPFAQWVTKIPAFKLQRSLDAALATPEGQAVGASSLIATTDWLWQQHRDWEISAARARIRQATEQARQQEEHKEQQHAAVLDALTGGERTSAELARATGLPRERVSSIVQRHLRRGLVERAGKCGRGMRFRLAVAGEEVRP